MSAAEIEEKFLSLAAPVVGDERARSVVKDISALESSESLKPLLEILN
jgi:hypothetical protein